MTTADDYQRVLAHERRIQELADAEMERVRQLSSGTAPATTTPSTSGKSVLEQALDAHEGRNGDAHMDEILGPPPGAAAPVPVPSGERDDAVVNKALDRMEAPWER